MAWRDLFLLAMSVRRRLVVRWMVGLSVGRSEGWLVCLSDIIPLMGGNVNFQAPIGALVIF